MSVIDLRKRFGRQYKIRYEESYYAQYGPRARVDDPAYQVIPCYKGHIFAWDNARLAASTATRGPICRQLPALPGVEIQQDGSDGITATFPVEMFDQVAALMGAKRRRRYNLTPEQRQEIGRRLAEAREAA